MKRAGSIAARVLVLTGILFLCFAAGARVLGQQDSSPNPQDAGATARSLLLVCFLNTAVLTHVVLRSRWAGWALAATVFLVFYGVMTFMAQIESAVFVTRLPPGMLSRLFLAGALIAAPFSLLAVLVLGRWSAESESASHNARLAMPVREWAWKLTLIALAYVWLYFTFGYFVAWRSPAVREYYGGLDAGSFLAHMRTVLAHSSWLIPFQLMRAILWVALGLPVIRMLKGGRLESALAVASLFAVLMNAQLLLPNPYMPEAVRLAHLSETATSNFLFGLLVGGLLSSHREGRARGRAVRISRSWCSSGEVQSVGSGISGRA